MPAYPVVAFVDRIDPPRTVLLNCNDGKPFLVARDGFSLGAPTYDGDPMSIAVRWGYRTLGMNLHVSGTNAEAAAAYGALARQLTAATNLLMVQLDRTSAPVFFVTYRTAPGEIDMSEVTVDDAHRGLSHWNVAVALTADAFGSGTRVDLPAVTIANDPLAASNPMSAPLGAVVGDVPTPAYIWRTGGMAVGQTHLLGIDHAPASTGVPPVARAAPGTLGSDATVVTDASASGGSAVSTSFTTAPGLAARVTGIRVPATEPGAYRLFARVKSGGTSSVYRVQYVDQVATGPDLLGQVAVFAPTTTDWYLASLGVWQFPSGAPLGEDGLTGAVLGRDTDAIGAVRAARDSGAAALVVDYVTAVPAYGDLCFTTAAATAPGSKVWDGYSDTVSVVNGTVFAAPTYKSGTVLSRTGGLPNLWPGAVNRLWYVANLGAAGSGHVLTPTTTLNVSYWPRWVWLR